MGEKEKQKNVLKTIFLILNAVKIMFEHFEHKADIGIRGKGHTLGEAFEECALALTEVLADSSRIQPKKSHVISLEATDNGALLVSFLNELLFLKDSKKMVYSKFRVRLGKENKVNDQAKQGFAGVAKPGVLQQKGNVREVVTLKATLFGEKINPNKHTLKTDAKAATYSELFAGEKNKEFIAQCVIDV